MAASYLWGDKTTDTSRFTYILSQLLRGRLTHVLTLTHKPMHGPERTGLPSSYTYLDTSTDTYTDTDTESHSYTETYTSTYTYGLGQGDLLP